MGTLAEARKLAIDAHLKLITLSEFASGPIKLQFYLVDPVFVPPEPKWLSQGIASRLEATLAAANES